MKTKQGFIRIQGKIIKVEPARKTGYYLIIQEQETNCQKGVFSQWSYELGTNGLFTLRQDNKYCLITDYQVLSETKLTNSAKVQKERCQEQTNNQTNYYQQKQAQEIQRKFQLVQEQKETIQKLEQQVKSLIKNEKLLKQLLKQKEAERLTEVSQFQDQLKEQDRIIKLNELELEKKISPYNSIERLYHKKHKTSEQEKYLWELSNLFNQNSQNLF